MYIPGIREQQESSLPGIIKYPLGLLGEIGWALDWPGRQLRKLITGLPDEEATGRAVLEKLKFLGPNKEGFDAGDVAGFGAEVALDPLTWLTGGLTAAGKSAARLSKLTKYAKAAENVPEAAKFSEETTKKIAQLVGEGAKPLAEGWKAQGLTGQRDLLRFHVPFTKIDKTLVKAPGILAGMEGLGTKIAGMGGPVKWLRKGFDPSYGKPADLAEDEIIRNIIRREGTMAAEEAAPKFGLKEDPTFVRGVEAWGKPEDLAAEIAARPIVARNRVAELMDKLEAKGLTNPAKVVAAQQKIRQGVGKRTAKEIAKLNKQLAASEGAIKALTPEQSALVPEFKALMKGQEEQALKEGLMSSGIERYYPRTFGPGAAEFREKFPTMEDTLRREFSTESGYQQQRQIRNLGTPEAAALMSKAKGVEKPYYQLAPGKALYQRMSQQAEDIANLRFAQSIVNKAVPYKQGLTMPVEAFAEGIKGNLKIKPGTGIPFEHAAYYKRLTETSHLPPEIREAVNLFDKVSGFYRLAVTRLFPAFHGRNIINDLTQTAESGIFNIRDAPAAARMSGDEKAIRQLEPLGFISGSRSAEMKSQLGAELKAPKSKAMQALETKYLNRSENFTRILHFLNAKRAGMTDLEAAEHVNKWLLNYSNLTPWEKTVMRRGAFFYSWPALMAKSLPKFAAENPQGYAFLTRAMTQPTIQRDTAIPEFMRQSISLPAGKDPQGNPQFVTGIGSPLDVINKFDVTSPAGISGLPDAIMRKLGAELNPLIKYPLEAAAGKEFFMDRPIIHGTKAPAALNLPGLKQIFGTREEKTATGGTRYEADPFLLHMLRSSPLSRLMQTGSQVTDIFAPEKQKAPLARIAQLLTGVRVPSVDPVDKLRTEVKLMRDQFTPLQAAGKAGTVEEPFLTKEGKLDPEALRLMEQFRSTRKKLRTTREQGQFVVPP